MIANKITDTFLILLHPVLSPYLVIINIVHAVNHDPHTRFKGCILATHCTTTEHTDPQHSSRAGRFPDELIWYSSLWQSMHAQMWDADGSLYSWSQAEKVKHRCSVGYCSLTSCGFHTLQQLWTHLFPLQTSWWARIISLHIYTRAEIIQHCIWSSPVRSSKVFKLSLQWIVNSYLLNLSGVFDGLSGTEPKLLTSSFSLSSDCFHCPASSQKQKQK